MCSIEKYLKSIVKSKKKNRRQKIVYKNGSPYLYVQNLC